MDKNTNPTRQDLVAASRTFPRLPEPLIARPHFIDRIHRLYEDAAVVVVEGSEGDGRTTFLAQFATSHRDTVLSVFLRPFSPWAYRPEFLIDQLLSQLATIVDLDATALESGAQHQTYQDALFRVLRRQTDIPLYFVVDGLDEAPEGGPQFCRALLDLLPFGVPGLRFLFSAESAAHLALDYRIGIRGFPLPPFNLDETRLFFSGIGIGTQDVTEIQALSRGVPGRLATIRRLLASGSPPSQLTKMGPADLNDLYEVEWGAADDSNQVHALALAVLTCEPEPIALDLVARVANADVANLGQYLRGLSFLVWEEESSRVGFVSPSVRRFVADKLTKYKVEAHNRFIDEFLGAGSSPDTLAKLPRHFLDAGRPKDLLTYLSPEYFTTALATADSLGPLRRNTIDAVDAALVCSQDGDLLRFTLHGAALHERDDTTTWRAEVKARMALDDYVGALAAAHAAPVKEDRLQLLAAIVGTLVDQGVAPERALLDEIVQLLKEVDVTVLGQQARLVAEDIVRFLPTEAVEFIDNAQGVVDIRSRDFALADLLLRLRDPSGKLDLQDPPAEMIRSRIRSSEVQQLAEATALLLPDAEPAAVVSQLARLQNSEGRLRCAANWARHNHARQGALSVTLFGLSELLRASEYTPQAHQLCSLCLPFSSTGDDDTFFEAARLVDSIRITLQRVGPSADLVRLQLLVASGLVVRGETSLACDRVVEAYLFAVDLDELSTKCECLGRVVSFIESNPLIQPALQAAGLQEAKVELEAAFLQLLTAAAAQEIVCRGPVAAVAEGSVPLAQHFIDLVNTSDRRDHLRSSVFHHLLRREAAPVAADDLFGLARSIEDPSLKGECVAAFIQGWERKAPSRTWTTSVFPLAVASVPLIREAEARCQAACILLAVAQARHGSYLVHVETLTAAVVASRAAISRRWDQLRVGFEIAASLAPHSREDAIRVFADTLALKADLRVGSYASAVATEASLLLTMSAASCLAPRGLLNVETDIPTIEALVIALPAEGEQAKTWADLASRLFLLGSDELAKTLVAKYVRPLFERVSALDNDYREGLFVDLSYPLFRCNRTLFFEETEKQHSSVADRALFSVARVIAEKTPPSEPCHEVREPALRLTYDELVTLCEIAARIEADVLVFRVSEMVGEALVSDRHEEKYTREQRTDLVSRLRTIARSKFPATRFVSHEGYAVVLEAKILQAEREKSGTPWSSLVARARALPNTADQAFVLGYVADAMPTRLDGLKRETISAARDAIQELGSLYDRVERSRTLAIIVSRSDPELARTLLRTAMESSTRVTTGDVHSIQRSIVDLAHKIDPAFAAMLAEIVDDDPARRRSRSLLANDLRILEARSKILDPRADEVAAKDLPEFAWDALGALNAGRLSCAPLDRIRREVARVVRMPLSEAYPVLLWALANLRTQYGKTKMAESLLRPAFDSTIVGSRIAVRLAELSLARTSATKETLPPKSTDGHLVVKDGDRVAAFRYIEDWLRRVAPRNLVVVDPYFGPDDLEIVKLVQEASPLCESYVLFGVEGTNGVTEPVAAAFRSHWRIRLSAADPPQTVLVLVRTEARGLFPLHDRWILGTGCGLRLGTSLKSLGRRKTSEISLLEQAEAEHLQGLVQGYVRQSIRDFRGERIIYDAFTL